MQAQYTELLNEAEYLLLDGFIDEDAPLGAGLLEVVARLDLNLPFG